MNRTLSFLILLTLFSCASGHREEQGKVRKLYKRKKYTEILKLLKKGELKKDKKSKLLYIMETASAHFGNNRYQKSVKELLRAKELTDKYFTKSVINSVATSTLLNDNFEKFRGTFYEKSLVHYFLVASYFNIYKRGSTYQKKDKTDKLVTLTEKQSRDYLFKARAEVLAWDGFFEEIKTTFKSKTTYHFDLLVKLYGGLIHEEIGKRKELNISLILYQDAYKILNTLYPNFKSYNDKSSKYFEKTSAKKIKLKSTIPYKKEFTGTTNYKDLKNFIKYKILNVAYRYNKSKFRRLKKRFKISKDLLKEIKSKGSVVNITVNQGIIPKKTGKTINLGLIGMMDGIEDSTTKKIVMGIGIPILTAFAMNELGLYPSHRYMGRHEFRSYNELFKVSAKAIAIQYEVPIIEEFDNTENYFLVFKKNKKQIKKLKLSKIASLGDFAKMDLEDSSTPRILKKASRVALKHLAAISSAFATYKSMGKGKNNNKTFAKIASVAQYALLSKGIENSEKADVRFWSTLPKNVLQVETKLSPGKYDLSIERGDKEVKSYLLGQVSISKTPNNFTHHRPDIK